MNNLKLNKKRRLFFLGITLLLFINSVFVYGQQISYKQFLSEINRLEKANEYGKALDYLKRYKTEYQNIFFELSKEEIYLNEKLFNFEENLSIFKEGHKKGFFYLIHPALPKFKPYKNFPEFDSIAKTDINLRNEAILKAETKYNVVLPVNFSKRKKYPLFVIFHGGGSNFPEVKKHWHSNKLDSNFIKVYLQSYRHYDSKTFGWRSGDKRTDNDIQRIFNELKNKYQIDTSNVIVGGISAGGTCAIDLAIRQVIPVSGFVTFCPGISKNLSLDYLQSQQNLNLIGFIVGGENDYYLSKQKQMTDIFDKANFRYKHIIVNNMEHQYPDDEGKYINQAISYILNTLKINVQKNINFEQQIDKLLSEYYTNGQFNGNILISVKGEIVYHKSYGFSNVKDSTLLDTNTIFCLASISKIFTSTAIFILEKEGLLSLEDNLTDYISELPEIYSPIKIKHLLTHTSGIPKDKRGWQSRINTDNSDVLKFLKKQKKLDFKPGRKYRYSNNAFILLALVVEKISELTFNEFIKQNIFGKIAMNNSFVYSKSGKKIPENIALSYIRGNQADWPLYTYGSGGIYSTTYDFFLWDKAFFNYNVFDSLTVNRILTPVKVKNKRKNYGFGWGILKTNIDTSVGHTGGMFGFRTIYEHQINKNITIIIFTNIGDSTPIMEIRNQIDKIIIKAF